MLTLQMRTTRMSSFSLSHVPRSWVVFHSLLCLFGVANISFVKNMPSGLRILSLFYNVLIVLCTLPVFVMLFEEINWKWDVFKVIQRISAGMWTGTVVALSITSLVNIYQRNILHFLQSWNTYMDKAGDVNQINKRQARIIWRCIYIVVAISRAIIHVYMLAILIPLIDFTGFPNVIFPSLSNYVVLMQTFCAVLLYINSISAFVLICWLGLFCAVISTLSDELANLREEISNYSTSDLGLCNLVPCRCRYLELAELISQADTVFRWFIGFGLLIEMLVLCTSLYSLITTESNVIYWCDLIASVLVVWMYISPAITLTLEVRKYKLGEGGGIIFACKLCYHYT